MQQRTGHVHVVDVGRGTVDGVQEARVAVHADVGLRAEIPLVALLGLLHLGVAFAVCVLGRTRRCDQRRVDRRADARHQAIGLQDVVDPAQQSAARS